jgi:hypothetical protein
VPGRIACGSLVVQPKWLPPWKAVKAGTRQSQEPEYLSGSPHSFRQCGTKKLLRKKKNESWAMRCCSGDLLIAGKHGR